MSVSVACKNIFGTLGEGPHWDASSKCLYCVDVWPPHYLVKYNTVTGDYEKITTPTIKGIAGAFIIPTTKKDFVISTARKIQRMDWDNYKITNVCPEVEEGTKNNLNDAKCDASGRLWTGTLGPFAAMEKIETMPRGEGSLYSLERNGKIRKHVSNITLSNGIAWTNDNRTMFFVDTIPGVVYAFDFDLHKGKLENQRTLLDFPAKKLLGTPDGMCMDVEDKLWIACLKGRSVIRVDCSTGQVIRKLEFPVAVTSCCFGGANKDVLYVTSMGKGLLTPEEQKKQHLAGSLFKVTGLGVRGAAVYEYDPNN